jgi:diguanylate cyclase (GGDEF)-like protein/PAS domain S-box-containing protein
MSSSPAVHLPAPDSSAQTPELPGSYSVDEHYEHAACGFLTLSLDGVILAANATLLEWTGLRRADLLGLPMASLLTRVGRLTWETQVWTQLRLSGQVKAAELQLRTADDAGRSVLVSCETRDSGDGREPVVRLTAFDAAERVAYERELVRARTTAERSESRLKSLHRVIADLAAATGPDQIADYLADTLADVFAARAVAVWRTDEDAAGHAARPAWAAPFLDRAARAGALVVVESAEHCGPDHPAALEGMRQERLQSVVAVPLLSENGTIGAYCVGFRRARAQTEEDLELHRTVGRHAGQALQRASVHEELGHLALHDGLTGLPNRLLLYDRIEQALCRAERRESPVYLMLVDLDGFKAVNDGRGHAAGDEVLVEVARRLSGAVRPADTVARLGGDEFVILCEPAEPIATDAVVARLEEAIRRPMLVEGEQLVITASIGVVLHLPGPGVEATGVELVREADTAMYRAKRQGKDQHSVYDATLRAEAEGRARIESLVRESLEGDGVVLHYQPIFDLATGRATGVEALCRLAGPDGRLVMPGEFIAVAERRGLILHLGRRVLMLACQQIADWHRQGLPHIDMSVNIAAEQAAQGDFPDLVAQALAQTGCPPDRLVLELTESTLLTATADTLASLTKVRDLGVGIAIDDFGTRYASLHYVQHFPLTELKIDQSFVRGVPGRRVESAIVSAVAGMALSLDLVCVAEGIETVEQRDFLAGLGVRGQGYYLGRPSPAEQCAVLLEG